MPFCKYLNPPPPCTHCGGHTVRLGEFPSGARRYLCRDCGRRSSDHTQAWKESLARSRWLREQERARAKATTLAGYLYPGEGTELPPLAREVLEQFIRSPLACQIMGVTRVRLGQLIAEYRIPALSRGGMWWVHRESAEKWQKEGRRLPYQFYNPDIAKLPSRK